MQHDLLVWEDREVWKISQDEIQAMRVAEKQQAWGYIWSAIVEEPTEKAWDAYRRNRKRKSLELAERGRTAMAYWRKEFEKWGIPGGAT